MHDDDQVLPTLRLLNFPNDVHVIPEVDILGHLEVFECPCYPVDIFLAARRDVEGFRVIYHRKLASPAGKH